MAQECHACGYSRNSAAANRCAMCASPLLAAGDGGVAGCPECTFENPAGEDFCAVCGTYLGGASGGGRGAMDGWLEPHDEAFAPIVSPEDPEGVAVVPALHYLPLAPTLISYGGGDDLQLSPALLDRKLAPDRALDADFRARVVQAAARALEEHRRIPAEDRIAKLPYLTAEQLAQRMEWHAFFQIRGMIPDTRKHNLVFHPLLFAEAAYEAGRQGAIAYPLVGWWGAAEVAAAFDPPADPADPGNVGLDGLRWADQHIHHVDQADPTWYFGSDMARFHTKAASFAAWGTGVDLSDELRPRCWATLMVVVEPAKQDAVERAIRKCTDGALDLPQLARILAGAEIFGEADDQGLPAACRRLLLSAFRAPPAGAEAQAEAGAGAAEE